VIESRKGIGWKCSMHGRDIQHVLIRKSEGTITPGKPRK
jgi:hypothetical protein